MQYTFTASDKRAQAASDERDAVYVKTTRVHVCVRKTRRKRGVHSASHNY